MELHENRVSPIKRLHLAAIEVFVAMLCILSGVAVLATALPWGIALILGGGLNLLGIMTGGIRVRRAGFALLTAGSTISFGVLLSLGGMTLIGGLIYLVFIWAMATRYLELGRILKERESIIKEN